ncbi:MAG: DUF4430 domain-containing protein [Euryarchaeota archaeon]|nr:DUF4430 domain-containing protein [Euryarchaeota archaeon]
MNRSALALAAVVAGSVLVAALLVLAVPWSPPEKKGPAVVSVVIDFGGRAPAESGPGTAAPWNVSVRLNNGTVFSALEKAASSANFTFKSDWYPNFRSHRVTEIAGVRDGTDNRFWQFHVNGVYVGTGADNTALSDGDTVRWEFRSALQ